MEHISFSWGRKPLLGDVTLTVAPGETVALAGVNGAGKSTLLRIAAGLLRPESGRVTVDGVDAFGETSRYHRWMGWLPERAPAEPDMTVKGYLEYRARLKGEQSRKIRHRVQEAMGLCGVQELADSVIGTLSFGLRKRVALADAILLRPRLLLLDDLFAGLDDSTRGAVGRIFAAVSSFAAVLASGHELEELARIAGRFVVLHDGALTPAKTPAEVRAIFRGETVGGKVAGGKGS